LNLEKSLKKESKKQSSVISLERLSEIAESNGIMDKEELTQAIRFLNDLGSVQYFELEGLNNKIIINPQWLIDTFSRLVTVKETAACIRDGQLEHKNLPIIWKNYDETTRDWILKLTEEFDLTFAIKDKQLSIVPCMLPEQEAEYTWPQIDEKSQIRIKEFRVMYNFVYQPSGLFNRIQSRLYNYSEDSIFWKMGTFLRKNNHIALVLNIPEKSSIEIRVQGVKPENIIFLIHEVIETLINESLNGIKYDFSFPCPECVEALCTEPGMISSFLVRRAHELKAPYIQCHKFFHTILIQEMLSIMPSVDGVSSNFDLNLEYSLRDLKKMKTEMKYDVTFWYCKSDVPPSGEDNPTNCINPLKVIEHIKKENYALWYPKSEKDFKMDKITLAIKESKMVILGISDQFAQDDLSLQVFELVKNIIKKSYLIVEFGKSGVRKWLEDPVFASVCCDVRVIMQDPKRYPSKIVEVIEGIERQIKDSRIDKKLEQTPPDLFISYCWSNSHDAVKKGTKAGPTSLGWCDPRDLIAFFKKHNIECWVDINEAGSGGGLFGEITKGKKVYFKEKKK
jgi:hypothetical protein